MMLHPNVQRLAQEELDRVSPDRFVNFADREKCPYMESIMLEVGRYHPVAPMGVPHGSEKNDVFDGKRIPKGSLILYNVWYERVVVGICSS